MNTERMAEPKDTTSLLERPRSKEGYPFPDINSYVVALKNRLHIPEERLQELRRTRGVKLEEWMPAVQPIEDDRPPVRAKIGSKGVLLSSDIKLPGKITENTPVSQVLQTDALYLAKLKYLREVAPQTTSWGKGRTKEKQVKQQITELASKSGVTGGKIDRISFKEALVSLDKKKMAPALVTATFALASCTGGPKPIEPSPTEPIITEVAQVPTASPEAISSFNESAQKIVDEAFKGLGIYDINMVGAGILADPEGREYALFTSILPDKNNETDLDFLLIGEVGTDSQVENIKGLVLDEEQQGSVLEFIAVSFNPDTETFVIEGPFIRTNTQTGEIEIFNNGSWRSLEGPERTINDVKQRLGHGVLAAISLPIPTPEVRGPSAQELQQLLVGQGLEVEAKELEDGTEIVVRENEWSLDVLNAVWAEGINPQDNVKLVVSDDGKDATLIYHQEQILAFSDENYGSFLTQDGQITTWKGTESLQVKLPEGTTEISFFDKHNGEWYAIDAQGRAAVKLNEVGEWERYERPVKIARWELIQEPPPSDITEELNPEEISRLVGDEGETVPYGYLFERSAYDDGKPTHVFVSGYPLGMFVRETPVGRQPILAFEVPVRYERQIMFFMIPDQTSSFQNLYFIPISRNINERGRHSKSFHELSVALSNPEAVGNQMIIAFQIRNKDDRNIYNNDLEELVTALKKREGFNAKAMFAPSYTWMDESLFSR